ncbi:MAG: carboxylating nicotinate-nucleotide diphosphorylase [Flavobacteriales bacterium]|nr:carboxylating nicotinate-nucleotide diphosphorylase [Flavobacteriales bacterium]
MIALRDHRDELLNFIDYSLREDVGDGDHSSLACIPTDATGQAQLLCKAEGVIAGLPLAELIFQQVDPNCRVEYLLKDGDRIKPGDIAFKVTGPSIALLTGERLVLNCLQRMSAVATRTRKYQDLLKGLPTKVLDTRKTTPGLRLLEKYSVQVGGGMNHRFGLYDMVMLKDNHLDFAGGIAPAIEKTKKYLTAKGKDLKIEVEARDLNEVREILAVGGVHRIMLDNFNYNDTRKAVALIAGRCEIESSGGITEETIREYAECGVDFISVGALTHSMYNLDMSLKAAE